MATGPADASTEPAADAQTEAAGPVDIPVDTQSAGDSGLPAWVAPVVVVLLLGGAGVVALTRRRAQP